MSKELRQSTDQDCKDVDEAIAHLRKARDLFKKLGSPQTLRRVRAALSSADGARRHVTVHRFVARLRNR